MNRGLAGLVINTYYRWVRRSICDFTSKVNVFRVNYRNRFPYNTNAGFTHDNLVAEFHCGFYFSYINHEIAFA